MTSIFFGYAGTRHSRAETIRAAARTIQEETGISTVLWEDMKVDGRVIIEQVLDEIDAASMCIFDLTNLSENVLFEAGYAISKAKPIWLTIDATISTAMPKWKEFALLNPLGYTAYRNSSDLARIFRDTKPLYSTRTAYDDLIEPNLPVSQQRDSLFYCLTFEPFEASNRLSMFLDGRRKQGLKTRVSDPRESTLESITRLAPNVLGSAGVLIHLASSERNRSSLHNRRHSLLAGMTHGFDVPLLLLAEEEYVTPFDYQTLLYKYGTPEECVARARKWLDALPIEGINWSTQQRKLGSALSGLRFGEHVAENELADLADYFVETSAFEEVVAARDTIFVGQRGTGKTANASQAYEYIASNKTNLAVLIKPPGFEFPAIFSVISKLPDAQRDYFLDALWRFIIQTEIAAVALARIEDKVPGVPLYSEEEAFARYADSAPFDIRQDMSVRLEQALNHLLSNLTPEQSAEGTSRSLINEAFHDNALNELRSQLGGVLKEKNRVAVFVDNLDKGWQKGADFKQIAQLILGLLTARGRLVRDFSKQNYWRDRIRLTVAMFLRSDIYNYLKAEAREPDKLPLSTISWRDSTTLLRVIEERFAANNFDGRKVGNLWSDYFCAEVDGVPTRDYLTAVVLPRPRDIVYLCNEAIGCALDRRHMRVEADDFIAAEQTYSQHAYEALLVENGVTIPEMEDALLALLGSPSVIAYREAHQYLVELDMAEDRRAKVLDKLVSASFFGVETRPGVFTYPEAGSQARRAHMQAVKLCANADDRRLQIHRAFHSFLDIQRATSMES